jgi:hypothetical protein
VLFMVLWIIRSLAYSHGSRRSHFSYGYPVDVRDYLIMNTQLPGCAPPLDPGVGVTVCSKPHEPCFDIPKPPTTACGMPVPIYQTGNAENPNTVSTWMDNEVLGIPAPPCK